MAVSSHGADSPSANPPDFSSVQAVFDQHCVDCHSSTEPEAKLVMEDFASLMKGGQSGPALVPGRSAESLLVKMIEGTLQKDGKQLIMPPGKRKKLATNEITLIKSWIDAGAPPPAVPALARELVVPQITPKVPPRRAIHALAFAAPVKLAAVARYGEVELWSPEARRLVRRLEGHRGNVNALAVSPDGKHLFAAGGENARFGEVRQWNLADGQLVRVFTGHRDALFAVALSPDGRTLATGSYDQQIKLWDVATGEELRTLAGHNGCVFDLAFRPDGKILASASADRTVKLWDVASGQRRDTLSQSLKELHTVAFSPDGKRLAAGGADNRIRVWEISDTAAETTNPLLHARFAHEGAILNLLYSADGKTLVSAADDRTVKVWEAPDVKERTLLPAQPDWPAALALLDADKTLLVGRLDGSMEYYDPGSGKVVVPPKPELARAEPRGLPRGMETRLQLTGANLAGVTELKPHHPKLSGEVLSDPAPTAKTLWVRLTAADDLPRGSYEISVVGPGGESGKIKLHVDSLPQIVESEATPAVAGSGQPLTLPVNCWGALEPAGDADAFVFEAKAGQALLFDVAARSLGSKANVVLTLEDAQGRVLASNNDFESGDPLLTHTFAADGRYTIRVGEFQLGGSADHFYRLSIGALPYVTGVYPLSIPAGAETAVELVGHHLPDERRVKVTAETPGELEVPVDPEKFRSRRAFKVIVGEANEALENEPNDRPEQATRLATPGAVAGRIGSAASAADADLFRFDAKAGQTWIVETVAARRGSPADTKIEVLHADGRPVERLLLQAVRNSAVTFRGISSDTTDCRVENWEEMELNEFLYLNGEVVRLFRAPQGPDSGFLFYAGSGGKRRAYFDTSATGHALDEPCYIVEPKPPGTKPLPNGLPAIVLPYENDDDGERKLGADSKLHFTAPRDGSYLVRVTDARGFGGERFGYRLVVREARPDFQVTLGGANPTVPAGSGQMFTVTADRRDGFDGEIAVEITGLPPGFSVSSPLLIEAGHTEARGTLHAAADAPQPEGTNATATRVTATARVNGEPVTRDVNNFGTIKLGKRPKLLVELLPAAAAGPAGTNAPDARPLELTIAPGQTIPARLRIQRQGHEDLVTFTVENLPHGVIVDNIGLNGVLIPKGESEREIFLTAARWVPESDRPCFAIENQAGRQTSRPVMLHVRKPGSRVAATGR